MDHWDTNDHDSQPGPLELDGGKCIIELECDDRAKGGWADMSEANYNVHVKYLKAIRSSIAIVIFFSSYQQQQKARGDSIFKPVLSLLLVSDYVDLDAGSNQIEADIPWLSTPPI